MTIRLILATAGTLLFALLLVAIGPSCRRTEPKPHRNVLLVLVDTLRADRLGLYGYERPTSPVLERFAERAVVFDNAMAQAGCTFPSVNSLLTSRYPQHFLAERPRRLAIPDEMPTLAEILGREGYATAAVSSSWIVRDTPSKRNREGGYGRGFDTFDEECGGRRAPCVRGRAIQAIDAMPRPFFAYAHFMEPHEPYAPHRDHERHFATGRPEKKWVRRGSINPIREHLYRRGPEKAYDDRDVAFLRDLYDEEILFFDRQFELLLDDLEERGLLEDTIVVFTSDHGEELLDHGEFAHCRHLAYNTVLRTPLMIYLPSAPGGSRNDGAPRGRRQSLAQNLDLVPTLLDYLGIDASAYDFEGRSLRPVIESDRPVHRYLFASQGTSRVVTDGDHKLLYDLERGSRRLFDWRHDIAEATDLSSREPQVADRLQTALFAWMDEIEGPSAEEESIEKARETERELRAVGYL